MQGAVFAVKYFKTPAYIRVGYLYRRQVFPIELQIRKIVKMPISGVMTRY